MSYKVNHYPEGVPRSRKNKDLVGIHLKNRGKIKATTDELGATRTEHWDDRVDMTVRPKTVQLKTAVRRD